MTIVTACYSLSYYIAYLGLRSTCNVLRDAQILPSARAKSIAHVQVCQGVAIRAVGEGRL
jgi:hypothetical protein